MADEVNSRDTVEAIDPSDNALKFDFTVSKKASGVLRAVNHKLRQRMLFFMDQKGRVTVTELFTNLNLEQSVASQHLAILRQARVVRTERDGKFIYYSVNHERLKSLGELASQIVE